MYDNLCVNLNKFDLFTVLDIVFGSFPTNVAGEAIDSLRADVMSLGFYWWHG